MKVRFDLNLQAWIRNVEVEGDNYEDCLDKLYNMSAYQLVKEGCAKDVELDSIDGEVLETDYLVKTYNIDYALDEEDVVDEVARDASIEEDSEEYYEAIHEKIAELFNKLPQELTLFIKGVGPNDDLDDLVADAITDETDYLVNSCKYTIIAEG